MPFFITNTFDVPIYIKDIINSNPELSINILPEIKLKIYQAGGEGMLLGPN